jgi:D-alanine-D-alanine ligase
VPDGRRRGRGLAGAGARPAAEMGPMKRHRVLVLVHDVLVPPPDAERLGAEETWSYQMELDVKRTLGELGHEVELLGVGDELRPIRERIAEWQPHIVFNILTDFHGVIAYEAHVVSYLELLKQPYTGCNPRGIMLANDKVLSKQIMSWHRIPCPAFASFPLRSRRAKLPARMHFPVIVKSANSHGSAGIAQASIVHDDAELQERVGFVHRTQGDDAIVEQFIPGRELTVSVVGNERLLTLPPWELWYDNLPKGNAAIATSRVKWDVDYAQKIGIRTGPARELGAEQQRAIQGIAKRVYRALQLSGYARIDLRMDDSGKVYVIEANVNADLTASEEFAEAALAAGLDYGQLLERIIGTGLAYKPEWKVG